MHACVEYLNRYDNYYTHCLGVGGIEFEQEHEERGPFRPMKFPEQVTLVKV